MDLNQRFGINQKIVYREEEDGAFLFDPETGNLKYMNRNGKALFLMLKDKKNLGQAVQHLVELFPDVKRRQIEKDVEAFIEQLQENEFISFITP